MTSPLLRSGGGTDPTRVIGRRVGAWLLDQLLASVVVLGLGAMLGVRFVSQTGTNSRGQTVVTGSQLSGSPGAFAALAVVSFLYAVITQVVLVAQYGWSPGKLLVGLRVVGWDGRPPGVGKALVRGLVNWVGSWLSCLWYLPAFGIMNVTKGHRQPADMAANTYVIDGFYLGRMIIRTDAGVTAGPPAVHRDEAAEMLRDLGDGLPRPPAGHRPTEPFYDKQRDTYVVFSAKREAWLAYDKLTDTWNPIG